MNDLLREHFDRLLEQVIASLPPEWAEKLDEVPLVVEDYPARDVMEAFELESRDQLCGLHDGIPLTERSWEDPADLPGHILLYREGILAHTRQVEGRVNDQALMRQIRITLLHELGHHFGLDEDQLRDLGYE